MVVIIAVVIVSIMMPVEGGLVALFAVWGRDGDQGTRSQRRAKRGGNGGESA